MQCNEAILRDHLPGTTEREDGHQPGMQARIRESEIRPMKFHSATLMSPIIISSFGRWH